MSQPDLDFPLGSETPSLDDSIISDVPIPFLRSLRPPEIKGMITTPLTRCNFAFEDLQYASWPRRLTLRDSHHDSASYAVVPIFHLSLLVSSQKYV